MTYESPFCKKVDFLSQMNGRVVQDKALSTLNVIYFCTFFTLIELIKLDLLSSSSIIKYKYIKGTDDGAQRWSMLRFTSPCSFEPMLEAAQTFFLTPKACSSFRRAVSAVDITPLAILL